MNEKMYWYFVALTILICKNEFTQSCDAPQVTPEPILTRAQKAESIVYGEVVQIYPWKSSEPTFNIFTAEIRMLCPLKNEEALVADIEEITVERIHDPNEYEPLFNVSDLGTAQGRCFNFEVKIIVGNRYFLFIQKSEDQDKDPNGFPHAFVPDEVNQETAVFMDTAEHRSLFSQYITAECHLPKLKSENKEPVDNTHLTIEEKATENEKLTNQPRPDEIDKTELSIIGPTNSSLSKEEEEKHEIIKAEPNSPGIIEKLVKLNVTNMPHTTPSSSTLCSTNTATVLFLLVVVFLQVVLNI